MIKSGFVLRKMPGMQLVMPTGARIKEYKGSLMLNETGAFIFEKLQQGCSADDIAALLEKEYKVTYETAKQDVLNTIASLKEAGVAE